jgi:hypothetical protein
VDSESLQLLEDGLRKTMTTVSGQQLDAALTELGWLEMLDEMPYAAVSLVFRLLGETGAHAPVLNDVVLRAAGRDGGGTIPLPYAGGSWIEWERTDQPSTALGDDLPIHRVAQGDSVPVAAGRHALGWWLVGAGRAMLTLARQHVRSAGRVVPGDPASVGRDAGRHRGRGKHLVCRRSRTGRTELSSRQGRRRPGGIDHRAALPAGARRYRFYRRA